jgi:histidine ammonia-lyase
MPRSAPLDPRSSVPLSLTGADLTPAVVAAVARDRRPVTLADEARRRMAESRAVVDLYLAENRPAYGLTTGLGPRVVDRVPREELEAFSRLTVLGRAQAVGEPLPAEVARAAMLARANGLAVGGSGAQVAVAEALVALLNAGIHPVVPSIASVGASDLCLMAHIGLGLIGEGEAELAGAVLPAAEALQRAGVAPLTLGPKDGLAICSSNAISAGHGALVLHDVAALARQCDLAAALTMEGFRANLTPIDPRAVAARPAPGQAEVAARLRGFLEGGTLTEPGAARRVQDPLSLRCVSQVHGSLLAAIGFAEGALVPELNGAGDNPLVAIEGREMISTGNFQVPALALAFDALALALSQVANLAVNRFERLLTERLSALPTGLSMRGITRVGFGATTKAVEALAVEIRHLANPVSADQRTGADNVEDDSTNAPYAVAKAARAIERLRLIAAFELTAAAQAVELARVERLGRGTAAAYRAVRDLVRPLDDDRPLGTDVERLAAALRGGTDWAI